MEFCENPAHVPDIAANTPPNGWKNMLGIYDSLYCSDIWLRFSLSRRIHDSQLKGNQQPARPLPSQN